VLISTQHLDQTNRIVYSFRITGNADIRKLIVALERINIFAAVQPNYWFVMAQNTPVTAVPPPAPPAPAPPPADVADKTPCPTGGRRATMRDRQAPSGRGASAGERPQRHDCGSRLGDRCRPPRPARRHRRSFR